MKSKLFMLISGQSWFIRYKLHHIPFWFLYHIIWWTITIGSFSAVAHNILYSAYSIKFLFYVIFQAIGVYFNLYFLIPNFLQKGKYLSYVVFLFITILVTTSFIVSGYYCSAYLSNIPFKELYQKDPGDFMYFFSINALPSTVASMTLAMSIKLTKNWVKADQRQHILERENLETELKFLKSQFNPHFLFNTINSIFVLIHKNPDLASESLATFSDMLRYQLYECNENEIELDREISFIDDFIQLEKLRIDENHTHLYFEIENNSTEKTIAPFILIPFIENSFKHVSKGKTQVNKINITLHVTDSILIIDLENTVSGINIFSTNGSEHTGIGLKNVKRRLDLLYQKKYQLNIESLEHSYKVRLMLELNSVNKFSTKSLVKV